MGIRDRIASSLPFGYRWCPRPMPSVSAFCLSEPSDRFINFVSFDTGVLAFECAFKNLTSDVVYSFRLIFFFVAFVATSSLQFDSEKLDITPLSPSERKRTSPTDLAVPGSLTKRAARPHSGPI